MEQDRVYSSSSSFAPTVITKHFKTYPTGSHVALVETDAGQSFIKLMCSAHSPHTLACELIGTRIADCLGLPVLEYAILEVDDIVEIPITGPNDLAYPGPAFATKRVLGTPWSHDKRLLERIVNPEVVSHLVVFDTLVLNRDRYGPGGHPCKLDNVFFSHQPGFDEVELRVIDHSHCLTFGKDLTERVCDIANVKDEQVYGLFPEFREFLDRDLVQIFCETRLTKLNKELAKEIVGIIPKHWNLKPSVRNAIESFIVMRTEFVKDNITQLLFDPPQKTFL